MALTGRLQVVAVAAAAPGTSFPDRLGEYVVRDFLRTRRKGRR